MTIRAALLRALSRTEAALKAAPPAEPDRANKLAAEKKLAGVVGRYFGRLARRAVAKLEAHPPKQDAASASTKSANVRDEFSDEFFDDPEFLADLLAVLVAAQKLGALSLDAMLGLDLDLTATNKEAEKAAKEYAYTLIKDLTATSRETLQTVISEFVATPGMTIGDVIDRLPFNETRAALIATTEITRAYATGQAAAGAALAEQYPDVAVVKTWHSDRDDLVCPICLPMDGQEVEQDEPFIGGDGEEYDIPPSHVNCRCWVSYRTRI